MRDGPRPRTRGRLARKGATAAAAGADCSTKHKRHGVNVQVISDPAGHRLWLSPNPARPGARHDHRPHPQDHQDLRAPGHFRPRRHGFHRGGRLGHHPLVPAAPGGTHPDRVDVQQPMQGVPQPRPVLLPLRGCGERRTEGATGPWFAGSGVPRVRGCRSGRVSTSGGGDGRAGRAVRSRLLRTPGFW